MLDQVHKILGVVNGVLWLIIGLVILYAFFRAGTGGVEQVVGGTVNGTINGQSQNANQPGGQAPAGQAQPAGTTATH